MRTFVISAQAAFALGSGALSASAQSLGTAPEAKAMLYKAIAELKAGEANALAQFNKSASGFHDRDIFVLCFNAIDGKFTAHLDKPLLGTDVRKYKIGSNAVGQHMFDAVKEGEIASVSYMAPKPGTNQPAPKEIYLARVVNQGCGVSYFK